MMIGGGGKMEDNIWQDTINLPGRWAVRARIGDYRWEYWTILVYAGGGISEENENGEGMGTYYSSFDALIAQLEKDGWTKYGFQKVRDV